MLFFYSSVRFFSLSLVSCTSGSRSRLSQSVTVEEDNCCGCNVLAIRRQFLDRDLKQVQIVYTSCHDAVREGEHSPGFLIVVNGVLSSAL